MPTDLRAIIYTRVSTGQQAEDGTSLDVQKAACLRKAKELDAEVVELISDEGISGARFTSRPGIQRALSLVECGDASIVIMMKPDRAARDADHFLMIRKRILKAGCSLVYADGMNFDNNATGNLMAIQMAGFSEFERAIIRERTMSGKRQRAEEGQQPARSRPPYGYKIVTNAEVACGLYPPNMRGRYLIDDATSDTALRLFTSYASGAESLPSLCKKLNAEGVPAPRGGIWHESTVRVILTNPVYKGAPVSGKVKCSMDESRIGRPHATTGLPTTSAEVRRILPEDEWLRLEAPPLVSEAVWDAVQERLEKMRSRGGGNPKRLRMLSGLCYCPCCGARAVLKYQRANGKAYIYFCCGNHRKGSNLPGDRPCRGDLYQVGVVEQAAVDGVMDACQNPEAVAAALRVYSKNPVDTPAAKVELAKAEAELGKLNSEEKATFQGQIAGIQAGASPELYNEAFRRLRVRRDTLDERLAFLRAECGRPPDVVNATIDSNLLKQALENVALALTDEHPTGAERRAVLGAIVEKVVPNKQGADVTLNRRFVRTVATKDDTDSETMRDTFHTICMGIRTQR